MDQRTQFIADYRRHLSSLTEAWERFDISRETGNKWIERYEAEDPGALHDRSRRPHPCPFETPPEIVRALLQARRRHPTWGAKKLLTILALNRPLPSAPALPLLAAQ